MTPLAMQFFCASEPQECRPEPLRIAEWNHRLENTLRRINRQVNRAITPLADPPGGWSIAPERGDCNDYALTKRSELIRLGVAPGALRLAITDTPQGEPHAVLLVMTSAGDLVLDNLDNAVKTLPLSGYAIRTMSNPDPLRWTAS